MTIVNLARFQFAMTTVFHFFFVPFSIGTVFVVAIMESIYVHTKNEQYQRMAKFWGKIFLLSFAVGVVTGLIQEFQFGMNWSDYSRFMGDIFGAPLAFEALLSFFNVYWLVDVYLGSGWQETALVLYLDGRVRDNDLRALDSDCQLFHATSRRLHDSQRPGRNG